MFSKLLYHIDTYHNDIYHKDIMVNTMVKIQYPRYIILGLLEYQTDVRV